jgi:hypothetical protein
LKEGGCLKLALSLCSLVASPPNIEAQEAMRLLAWKSWLGQKHLESTKQERGTTHSYKIYFNDLGIFLALTLQKNSKSSHREPFKKNQNGGCNMCNFCSTL